jgi:predicted acetyltransferase
MGRVVDVAQIGGMRTGPGRLTMRVSDPLCPWNEGAWRLETVDGRLQVQSSRAADCALRIQGLSALVYGTHDPGDFAVRGWGDPSSEMLTVLRTMFPRRLPYLHEVF